MRLVGTGGAAAAATAVLHRSRGALAGTTGRIDGALVDAGTSDPIAGARVTATSPSQQTSTTTDARGHFAFVSLAPDAYSLSAEKQGYEPLSVEGFSVYADQTLDVNLSMRAGAAGTR